MTQVYNLDDQVRESLRERILTGELGGGAHLSELKLSKDFNVSRTPIREALCALAADGLIEMIPHRGAFVREIPTETKQDKFYVYANFMGMAARLATERADIETMLEFEAQISALMDMQEDAFVEGLKTLTETVVSNAKSQTLNEALNMISKSVDTNSLWANATVDKEAVQQQMGFLAAGFKRTKPEASEKAMREMMAIIGNSTVKSANQTTSTMAQA